jgi:predicted metal-dependent hydrolase
MELNELTPKQRKIVKIIILDGYDIGILVNEGLTIEDAQEVVAKGQAKLLQKKIGATTDDIDS